ncbi:MAG: mechanosensitive ion channel family protein [Treponema sp.]
MNNISQLAELMLSPFKTVKSEFDAEKVWNILQLLFALFVIYIFFKILARIIRKITVKKCSVQAQHIINKAIHNISYVVIILTIFHRLGINISAILGAAGIAGIAIGFAAQTSVSNVISGLFVITERAFKINDVIEISGTIGTVQSINLLSVVLRTFDNQYVRVPNETIIKANLINYSHFPYRRVKTELSVPYGADLRFVESVLLDTARKNPFVVDDPAPSVLWTAFGHSGINVTLHSWTKIEDFGNLRNSIFIEVNERLLKEGIDIPFQQIDIYMKEKSAPPVQVKPKIDIAEL